MAEDKIYDKLMNTVIICIGSNHQNEYNISRCKDFLKDIFGDIIFSECIDTKPYGYSYVSNFKNQLGCFKTNLDADSLSKKIKEIEAAMGRKKVDKQNGLVIIDIDLIKFNGEILKEKDWGRNYVQDLLPSLYERLEL